MTTLRFNTGSVKAVLQPSDRRRVSQCQVDPFPPWTISPPEVELDIPGLGRHDNPHLLAARPRELLALKYREEFPEYKDGSVLEDGRTGAGIFLEATREFFSVKLPSTTILTAELVAIKAALKKIIAFPDPRSRVTVLSDSRSSLVVIQRGHCPSSPDILNGILQLSDEAARMGVHLRYQWVPSHVGIHGDEMADKAAKHSALAPEVYEASIQLTANDAITKIDRAALAQWKTDYTATASHCLLLCPALKDHFKQLMPHLSDPNLAHGRLRADNTPDIRCLFQWIFGHWLARIFGVVNVTELVCIECLLFEAEPHDPSSFPRHSGPSTRHKIVARSSRMAFSSS
ncbi:uncharacterized protein LOC143024431 [Oratosquilla oratoria]|uniref:uncharacterized protein LOC143024431 n=1 Tax=Oratosquilla oratoria TaxID=337810 RepID=UPI003F761269